MKILSAGAAAAIHADLRQRPRSRLHARRQQQIGVLGAGKVAALVAVADLGLGLPAPGARPGGQRGLSAGEHKADVEGIGQLPGDHITAVPVQHGDQVEPTGEETDIGDIDAPDVVGVGDGQMAQKIGKNTVFRGPSAQVGSRADTGDPHLPHVALDRFAVDGQLCWLKTPSEIIGEFRLTHRACSRGAIH